jgi:hypothetical protein
MSTQPERLVSPIEADAAVEKRKSGEIGLGIPWTLRTRDHYWRHIDNKISKSSTDAPTSIAYDNRTSWTEILASWVCKEALDESKTSYTQMQKLRQEGDKTLMDPCFRIDKPLTFDQVQHLVERTVEIYRRDRPAIPKSTGRPFAERMVQERVGSQHSRYLDPRRSSASLAPPPLGRSTSLNGVPMHAQPSSSHLPVPLPGFQYPFPNASTTNLHIPPPRTSPNLGVPHPVQQPHWQPQAGSPQQLHHFPPGTSYPPYPQPPGNLPPQLYPIHSAPTHTNQFPHAGPVQVPGLESRRSSRQHDQHDRHDSMDSDTEDDRRYRKRRGSGRDRERERERERERNHRHDKEKNVKRLGTLAAIGTLANLMEHL